MEDLKFDLQVLNAALKKLDVDWDFTAFITPLLSDQGPALAVVPKLKRQIVGGLQNSGAPRRMRAKTRRGASRKAAMKKATMSMDFSAMELSV